jgi:hypothetical protein
MLNLGVDMYDAEENVVKIPVFGDNGNREGFLKLGRLKEDRHGQKNLVYDSSFSTWQGKPLPRGLEILCRQECETDSGTTFDYYRIYWHDPEGFSKEDCCKQLNSDRTIQWLRENDYELPDDLKKAVSTLPNDPITLIQFMKLFCVKQSDSLLKSRRKFLQMTAQKGGIQLPTEANLWKSGQAKYYHTHDLLKRWPAYCHELPNLPELDANKISKAGNKAT